MRVPESSKESHRSAKAGVVGSNLTEMVIGGSSLLEATQGISDVGICRSFPSCTELTWPHLHMLFCFVLVVGFFACFVFQPNTNKLIPLNLHL